jgi:hypothetical protein
MDNKINIEKSTQIKLKDLSRANTTALSLNNTFNSGPNWSMTNPPKTNFSLILNDSMSLEHPQNTLPLNIHNMSTSSMKNRRDDLELVLGHSTKTRKKTKNSFPEISRINGMENVKPPVNLKSEARMSRSMSTRCNMLVEEDDEEEMDRFLKQREGFKKHCLDEDGGDPNFLSDDEVDSIIKEKMRILEIYNVVVLKQGPDDVNFR